MSSETKYYTKEVADKFTRVPVASQVEAADTAQRRHTHLLLVGAMLLGAAASVLWVLIGLN